MRARLIVLLSVIGGFLPLVTDGFLPAMRPMMADLHASVAAAQLAVSLALGGFACAQLLVGVLADRFGRRPVLLAAIGLFMLASVGAALAPSFPVLLGFRFLQGFSAAAGPVVSRAVVRDLCSRVEGARILSFVGMGLGMVPLTVPALNALVAIRFGWRATFALYLVFLAAALAMTLAWFRETLAARDPAALSPNEFFRAARAVLTHRQALGYILCCMFGYAGLAVWIFSAPHLLADYFGQDPARFGLWWAIPTITYVLGGYLSSRAPRYLTSDAILWWATVVLLVAGAVLVAMLALPKTPVAAFVGVVALYNLGWAVVQPQAQAGALSYFPQLAGRVSALLGCLQMLGAATIGVAFGRLYDGTPAAASLLIVAAAIGAWTARATLATRPRPA